ncbi:hypothetical protein BVRB_5g103190 [Beta vulgaris subsp. vulgaris]|uniref:kinetochore protein SPC24 homolog n=1 Tax=Beta vulgaris subsp. vulgaris TaxID=3555 RepID=UPI0005402C7C|nr:kinetochore protein SPC24 homolog [Beta vulgaris subsp. vulgaris]KMT12386.1 hypothetical protein BVRB_5g103190 [Beta vulgaris subsp. vulgaris]
MGENSQQIDIKQLLSYCDDLVGVLRDNRTFDVLTQCVEQSKSIQSFSDSDFNTTQISISDYQKKIDDCKHKIEVARSEVVSSEEIDRLQEELKEELKKERLLREDLREIVDKINDLDHQRYSIEEQSQRLKKLEEEQEKEQRKLSFYASVTKTIPNLESKSKISGHIVERDKKAVQKFEFDPLQEDAFDICNKTWKMINQ